MDVVLRRLRSEAVDDLLVTERAERRDREDLGLATREEAGAMRARQQSDFARDGAHFFDFAAVRAYLLVGDHVAHDGLLEVVDGDGDLFIHLRVELEEVLHRVGRDLGDVGVAVELVRVADDCVEAVLRVVADGLLHLLRDEEELRLALLFAAVGLDALLEFDEALDLLMAEQDGVEDDVLRQLVGAGLDHHDGVVGAGDGEVQRRYLALLFRRVDDEFIVDAADAHARNRSHERDVGDSQGARCADHGGEFRCVVLLDGEDGRDDLDVVAEALREQRANRAVDQARAEDGVARRAALTLDEAPRDLACCIHLLFVVDRQREEVHAFARLSRCRGRDEHDGVAVAHEHGAVGLLRELSVLDDERAACEFHLKAIHKNLLVSLLHSYLLFYVYFSRKKSGIAPAFRFRIARQQSALNRGTQTKLCDNRTITLNIRLVEVAEQTTAMADHLQQTATGMMILLVLLEVLRQIVDTCGEDSDLYFRRTRITLVNGILLHDFLFCFLSQHVGNSSCIM